MINEPEILERRLARISPLIGTANSPDGTSERVTAAEIAEMVSAVEADVKAFIARHQESREPHAVFQTKPDRSRWQETFYARPGGEIYGKVLDREGFLPEEFLTTPRDVADSIVRSFFYDSG